ncbi:MAG: tetratricopeptide repeat protein [Phycisphaerales bacterium]|nr:MAG: tetratricopeptide repeat protein [Phycisphaerales bacterium]
MAMPPLLRRIIAPFCPRLVQTQNLADAFRKYREWNFAGAYAAVCRGIKDHPEWSRNGDVYILWADLELRVNRDIPRARDLLGTALSVGSFDQAFYYRVHSMLMWESDEREAAIEDMEKSVEADPRVVCLETFAAALSHVGDQRAMSVLQRILEKDPENCWAHIYIGIAALKSGDRDKALLMVRKAEELGPSTEQVFEIGRLYQELGEYQTAIDRYLEADRLGYEDNGKLYACIASCYFVLKDASAARKYVESALRFDPKSGDAHLIWAQLEMQVSGDLSRARESLDAALEAGSVEEGDYYALHGYIEWESGACERAIEDYAKSVEADPTVSNLTMLASALSRTDDKRALRVWQRVLEKDPNSCTGQVGVAGEAAKLGDRDKALLMAKKAERLNPSADDVFLIALVYHRVEEFRTAIDKYLEADKLAFKDKGMLYAAVADCYRSLGDASATRKYIEWAVRRSPEDDYVKEVQRDCEERFGG